MAGSPRLALLSFSEFVCYFFNWKLRWALMKKNIVRIPAQTCEASELRASSENAPDSCGNFGPGPLIMRRGLCPDADSKFGYPSIYLLGFWWHLSVASSLPKLLFKRPCVKMRPGPDHPWQSCVLTVSPLACDSPQPAGRGWAHLTRYLSSTSDRHQFWNLQPQF